MSGNYFLILSALFASATSISIDIMRSFDVSGPWKLLLIPMIVVFIWTYVYALREYVKEKQAEK